MNIDMSTLRDDFIQTGFAIVPNLFTRSEVQRLKLECIDILAAVKAERVQSLDTEYMSV